MWTNIFKISGLHQISWFQFLPQDFDFNALADKSHKLDQKDAAMVTVLSAHLQLQKEGLLSSWTNYFVGPWDPSQGLHNPDEKIKLWLFLPGQHSSVIEKAQVVVARLRVLASGIWVSPGDSEEVASALSRALRNCIERALRGRLFVRFGDAFVKYHPIVQNEEPFRRSEPVAEFFFAATEEAIFVHVVVSAKNVRALSSADIEPFLSNSSRHSNERTSVLVSPHGMLGKLTGYCPGDLVKQVYLCSGKVRGSNEFVGLSHPVAHLSGIPGQSRGQNFFVEVTLGCDGKNIQKNLKSNGNLPDKQTTFEKLFVYPSEAVLVPLMRTCFARSSLKRFWLQNWVGPSLAGSSLYVNCDFDSNDKMDYRGGSSLERNGTRFGYGYHSSSNSNSSSSCSMSSSSADGDHKNVEGGDLEADADSIMTRQSGLSSLDLIQSNGPQSGSKRPRAGTSESSGQAGVVLNPSLNDYSGSANDHTETQWGWDDDDEKGIGMDIQELLSEFGDFGDFFENDALPFGEPPGSEQSQAIMFLAPEGGELGNSPRNSMMDVSDQILLPSGFPSFDNFNQLQAPAPHEDLPSKIQDVIKSSASGQVTKELPFFSGDFDQVVKAEALMTFAPDYGAVEASISDNYSLIFRSPYIPKDYNLDYISSSNNYVYSATPPSSPGFSGYDKKSALPVGMKAWKERSNKAAVKSSKYYTYVDKGKQQTGGRQNLFSRCEVGVARSQFSSFGQENGKPLSTKASESFVGEYKFLTSLRNGVATQIECLMCQASMCRLRHTLMPSKNLLPSGVSGLSVNCASNQFHANAEISGKYEVKKKEMIPVRIGGDTDNRVPDGPLNVPVGVWRSVGIPKVNQASNLSMEGTSLPHNSFIEEGMLAYGQQQPLQELLDGIALLVQQATSFVDLALDVDCGDGPFGFLALEEQSRRVISCGPSMAHAGCGGLLASCHSLDIAGVELVDPLSSDVQASLTISLLQSDIKAALKAAFSTVEGPMSVADWCRGRSLSNEAGVSCEGLSIESTASASECRDFSVTGNLSAGEPRSPSFSSATGAPSIRPDGTRGDEPVTPTVELDQLQCSRFRPTLTVVPFPSILVGYQDDWLKTAASALQIWEKAPLEPYATKKHMSYYVVCPNIDPLITAAADFFLQLGTVYETCKLGTHAPQTLANEMELEPGNTCSSKPSGFVLLDCPQSMKIDTNNASMLGLISDYFLCLSNGWDLTSYLRTLTKVLKTLKFGSVMTPGAKEGNGGPCTVVYVVCPFPEPLAILQTVVESSIAIGSAIRSSNRERKSMVYNQVAKALSYSVVADESFSNVLTLTGFCIPKLVLQIVTVDAVFRVTTPMLNELLVLKEIAFTVYNKARRITKGTSGETMPSSYVSGRSSAVSMQMSSPVPGIWKEVVGPRIGGASHQRESELDSSLRPGAWDSSWQVTRNSGLGSDPNRNGDAFQMDDLRCLFEPLYILAEPGSLVRGHSPFSSNATESSKILSDDCASTSFVQSSASSGGGDNGPTPQNESSDYDISGSGHKKSVPSLHCCYGWTEDWRWMVCIWTDSRGELLDSYVYPFGGVSSRQDTKGLQSLFIQILQQGCHILQACSSEVKPREFVIARIGSFFELECQEWQKALYAAGGSDMKKWPLQLRRSLADGLFASSNGNPLQPQDMNLMQDRVPPSSPNPIYGPHLKSSAFIKGSSIAQASSRKLIGGPSAFDSSKGLLQWIQSISFVSVSMDHSLQLIYQPDVAPSGASQASAMYIEGYTPVKSLGSMAASYILMSPNMRFIPHTTFQLATCLTADSPPLAHLLHSKGSAIPLSTGFVVSKAVPSLRRENRRASKEEWPSVLSISLVDYYGGSNANFSQAKGGKRGLNSEPKEMEVESHIILEPIAAELHALSWMTVSPAYIDRRTALPFHCDMVLRLCRLLHFADKQLSRPSEKRTPL